ncbi:MAG: SDR family oxidoreductase [Candidatus Omnitrophica bacterium]|nr:SDR family oxidoreductase [Candidatus Omnitrophota bacterium]
MASSSIQYDKLGILLRGLVSRGRHLIGSFCPIETELQGTFNSQFQPFIDHLRNGRNLTFHTIQPGPDSSEKEIASKIEGNNGGADASVVCVEGIGVYCFSESPETARTVARAALFCAAGGQPLPFCPAGPHWLRALSGKIAFITGGASGIGLATAHRLLLEGACVTIGDINQDRLQQESQTLGEVYGPDRIQAVLCDVTSSQSVKEAFRQAALQWCGLDILVNNAGTALSGSLFDLTDEDYDRQNAIMPRGSFLCTRQAADIFRDQEMGGDIVYIASKNSVFAGSKNLAYSTAKAAQLHQARLAAVELSDIQVRVNVVNPDAVVRGSSIFSGEWAADRARAYGIMEEDLGKYYAQRNLLKAELLPEDIAAAVYVLVGPDLRKSTGLVINVDGGFAPSMMR